MIGFWCFFFLFYAQMGETITAASKPGMDVSVSFGRFDNDSLSWEKWSAFSSNKYLEEVEKCATPGSVAKKAAYFDAHYKKIAARKAEVMDQDNRIENDQLRPENLNVGDLTSNDSGAGSEFNASNSHGTTKEVVKQETNLVSEVIRAHADDLKEDTPIRIEDQRSLAEGVKEENGGSVDSPRSSKPELTHLVKEEEEEEEEDTAVVEFQDIKEVSVAVVVKEEEEEKEADLLESRDIKEVLHNLNAKIGNDPKVKEQKAKLGHPKESKKVK